ncbi:LytR/AlgR family response regulator transcription factor [Kordiimonas gwangyangensis]|uniref:LytR/AlgR family response regulator transcription factor n=1 Tax=Kordiimonas gwangyangensis TaxID=288022 RepID=UPI0003634509|nr:LytTR family DNA-binding domain-containing protein [Kordiimonas gwangyangensis]
MTKATALINWLLPTREERLYFLFLIAITAAIACVNSVTVIVDAERSGGIIDTRLPWLYEISSAIALLALYPALLLAVRRVPLTTDNWKTHLPLYIGFSVLFSAAHVTAMVAIRKLAIWLLFDGTYTFFGDILRESAYEYRKDVITFAMVVALAHIIQARAKPATAEGGKRIQLKSGSQTILLNANDFAYAKAAGNYVELLLKSGETHLVRMSMSALEATLKDAGVAVVRIHRSYLVAVPLVTEVTPKGDGDAELKLVDGTPLPVSRRYRAKLAEALS